MTTSIPAIIQHCLGQQTRHVARCSLGLSHDVFEVETEEEATYVVRLARPERQTELEQGTYWHPRLVRLGLPLPRLYHSGRFDGDAFAIYERLPGTDLEQVYPGLSASVKQSLARAVADIQRLLRGLADPQFTTALSWRHQVHAILDRSAHEMRTGGICATSYVDLVRARMRQYDAYLTTVAPVPFLYDLNIRNVMVHNEQVSGVIDVDEVWYGDPLLAIGRGKTLLLLRQHDTDYITAWCDYLHLTIRQREMVDLYALLYCVRFMGTLGQTLNGNPSSQTDSRNRPLLEHIAQNLYDGV